MSGNGLEQAWTLAKASAVCWNDSLEKYLILSYFFQVLSALDLRQAWRR